MLSHGSPRFPGSRRIMNRRRSPALQRSPVRVPAQEREREPPLLRAGANTCQAALSMNKPGVPIHADPDGRPGNLNAQVRRCLNDIDKFRTATVPARYTKCPVRWAGSIPQHLRAGGHSPVSEEEGRSVIISALEAPSLRPSPPKQGRGSVRPTLNLHYRFPPQPPVSPACRAGPLPTGVSAWDETGARSTCAHRTVTPLRAPTRNRGGGVTIFTVLHNACHAFATAHFRLSR
jgi:hypothetical protein